MDRKFTESDLKGFYEENFSDRDFDEILWDLGAFSTQKAIFSMINYPKGLLLNIGCGPGTFFYQIRGVTGIRIGIDLSQNTLKLAKKKFPDAIYVLADAEALPFKNGVFNVIVSAHALEHIPDDYRALSEMSRILKPGSEMIILTPGALKGNVPQNEYDHMGHLRKYNAETFKNLFKKVPNLKVDNMIFIHRVYNLIWLKLRLNFFLIAINFLIKKLILRDNKSLFERPFYMKMHPILLSIMDSIDSLFHKNESALNFIEKRYNIIVKAIRL